MLPAIVASTLLSLGLYFMKRQAERLPSLGGGWRIGSWIAFFRDPLWLLGLVLQIAGYGLYLSTLRDAPLWLVHTALSGGIAFFVVLAVIGLGETPRATEWAGVVAVSLGLIMLGISGPTTPSAATAALLTPTSFSTMATLATLAALALDRSPGRSIGLSVASGIMLGLAGMYAKDLASAESLATAVVSVAFAQTLSTNIIGFALMQGALQSGRGVIVVPIFSTLSNLIPIAAGIVVYGEAISGPNSHAGLRITAMLLALAGAAVLGSAAEKQPPIGRA